MVKTITGALLAALLAGPAQSADSFWSGGSPDAKPAPAKPASGKATPPPGVAPGLAGIETLEATLADAWERSPLTQRHAVFVSDRPELYGGFTERADRSFARGEKLLTYVEPVGYTWKPIGDGRYRFGFVLDFQVRTPDGRILAGQNKFQDFDFTSGYKNREVFVTVTMSLNGIEPGDYVLAYTLHDKGSDKASSFEQPFTIKE